MNPSDRAKRQGTSVKRDPVTGKAHNSFSEVPSVAPSSGLDQTSAVGDEQSDRQRGGHVDHGWRPGMPLPHLPAGPVAADACGTCDVVHLGQTYKTDVGFHSSTAPSDEQILARMKARRAARDA